MPIPPKPYSVPNKNSLYCAAFPVIILTHFSPNVVPCTQKISVDLRFNISKTSPDLPLRVLTLCCTKYQINFIIHYQL